MLRIVKTIAFGLLVVGVPLLATTLSDEELENHVTHYLQYLFYPHQSHPDIAKMAHAVKAEIIQFNRFPPFGIHYSNDVNRYTLFIARESIVKNSYNYACEITNARNARDIAYAMDRHLIDYLEQAETLEKGALGDYIGDDLRMWIAEIYNQGPEPYKYR